MKEIANIVRYALTCSSLYGIIALMTLFLGLSILGIIIYSIIHDILHYIYKTIKNICNAHKKYNEVHTKLDAKNISVEKELRR